MVVIIEKIPIEIWVYIVAFLIDSVRDVVNFTATCKTLFNASSLLIVNAPLVITDHNYDILLQKRRWNFTDLTWRMCSSRDQHILTQIGKQSFLKTFRLIDHYGIIDGNIDGFMSSRHHNIQHIIMSNCSSITDVSVRKITKQCPKLQSVNFSRCNMLTKKAVRNIATNCTDLRSVDFSYCRFLTDDAVTSVSKCRNLRSVDFSNCEFLTDDAVTFVSKCRNLRNVNFGYCSSITNEAIKNISSCLELQSVFTIC